MRKFTYVSLFSSAGIGCYGFKMNGFECVATNELLEDRLEIQRVNKKCKYESGYICGSATEQSTKEKIFKEIEMWKKMEDMDNVDVVFATPPCQGMSSANLKKKNEQKRNSLIVDAITMIEEIQPNFFVFENVKAFMNSICTDIDGIEKKIEDCIISHLSKDYKIYWEVVNFKDYGVPSSRPRTLVVGAKKEIGINPKDIFPTRQDEITLRQSIGLLPRLDYCESDQNDPFHFARPFPEYMLPWIKDLKEGESAWDNPDETKPCSYDKDGKRVINKCSFIKDKYRRLIWDKVGKCITTRSDIMSTHDTIHPCDNRVLSIREIMILMTIPNSFRWTSEDTNLTPTNAKQYLKKNEGRIRRCIGEAVPTKICYEIGKNIIEIYSEKFCR